MSQQSPAFRPFSGNLPGSASGSHSTCKPPLLPRAKRDTSALTSGTRTQGCASRQHPGCRAGNPRRPAAQELLREEAASHRLPSDGGAGTRASAACSHPPDCGRGEGACCRGPGRVQVHRAGKAGERSSRTGKCGRKRERRGWPEGGGGGEGSNPRSPVPSEDSGQPVNTLTQQAGELGAGLPAAGKATPRSTPRAWRGEHVHAEQGRPPSHGSALLAV